MLQPTFLSKLFSVFGRRTAEADVRDLEPRARHYYFAHEYLPELARHDAKTLVTRLRENSGNDYLTSLWETSGDDLIGADALPSSGLQCFPIEIAETYFGVLVQFPAPERLLEAYFAAILLKAERPVPDGHRYFTLELGDNVSDGSLRPVLCEWSDERHIHHNDGPEADRHEFCRRLGELLSAGQV